MTRWPKTLLTVAGTLLGVCVFVATLSAFATRDEPPTDPPTDPPRRGRVVNETPVLFERTTGLVAPEGWRVLDAPADYIGYSGWLVGRDEGLATGVRSLRSDDTYVHLVGHQSVGCAAVSGPLLRRDGVRYVLDFSTRPEPLGECYAPYKVLVIFRIPRADARITFGSVPALGPVAPGMLAAHFALTGNRASTVRPMEITYRADRDGLLATLAADGDRQDPVRLAADIEAALEPRPDDVRVFAFPIGSCVGATPVLDITEEALHVQVWPACVAPVPGLVVFVVPARVVPDGVTLG
jgi:hypothetical protein